MDNSLSVLPFFKKMRIAESELIINADGSVFHLHLKPEQLAGKVILVGDPARVDMVASFFDIRECSVSNREFHTVTGQYQGKRISVLSTGIGSDNIDIVLNELDALRRIDFNTREVKSQDSPLELVRIGTCGSLQPDISLGSFLLSEKSIDTCGLLPYYADFKSICEKELTKAFIEQTGYLPQWPRPTVVACDPELRDRIGGEDMAKGITVTANGFYGPQGRQLRLSLAHPSFNALLEDFRFGEERICNYEMESAALAGLAKLLGHKAIAICLVIANRHAKQANVNYQERMRVLVRTVLERM